MTEVTWKLLDFAWAAVAGLVMIVWNMLNGRIAENKRHLEQRIDATHLALDRRIDAVSDDAEKQRSHIVKLFDKLEQHSQESFKRHIELMQAINSKMDK